VNDEEEEDETLRLIPAHVKKRLRATGPSAAPREERKLTREQLFAFELDWKLLELFNLLEQRVRPWVEKEVADYLGMPEPTAAGFVVDLVRQRAAPARIEREASELFGPDAPAFVERLWRFLVELCDGGRRSGAE
jgi:hypothetical protein